MSKADISSIYSPFPAPGMADAPTGRSAAGPSVTGLPIWAVAGAALAQIPPALQAFLRLAMGWVLLGYAAGLILERFLGLEPLLAWGLAELLLWLGLIAADAAWLRHLLQGSQPRGWLAPLDRRAWSFLTRGLLLGLAMLLVAGLPPLLTGVALLGLDPSLWHLHPFQPFLAAVGIMALWAALALGLRLGPWVTAAAIDDSDLDLAEIWAATRGQAWRLAALTGMAALAVAAFLLLLVQPLTITLAVLMTGSADPLFGAGVPLPSAGGAIEPGPLALDLLAMALPALACHLPLQSLAAEVYRRLVWSPAAG